MGEEAKVTVRRHRNSWNIDSCSLEDVDGIHWPRFSVDVRAPSPQPFLYGYVSCEKAPNLNHSGMHGPCPHRIKVSILKKDNAEMFPQLLEIAGPKPQQKKLIRQAGHTIRRIGKSKLKV